MSSRIRPRCTICKEPNAAPLLKKFDLRMYQCRRCGVVFTHPMPTQDDTLDRYSRDWFEHEYLPSYKIDPQHPSLTHLAARFQIEIAPIARFRKLGRLLDVGAGAGLFLHVARDQGWSVSGVEIAPYGPKYAKQHFDLEIFNGTLHQAGFADDYFDVVLLQDTLEHLIDPLSMLEEVRRILRPGGAVVLTTPNFNSIARRVLGRQWALISPAEHVHLFSSAAVAQLLRLTDFVPCLLESDLHIKPHLVHDGCSPVVKLKQRLLREARRPSLRPIVYKYHLGDELHIMAVKPECKVVARMLASQGE